MSKFGFLCIGDTCECETLQSNCPWHTLWHTLQACTLTRCPWPLFYGPLTLLIFTSKFGFLCISDTCVCETSQSNCPWHTLWHTLQACTLTRCPWPLFYGPLTLLIFTSKFGFLCISDTCECETLHSNCPWHTLQARLLTQCPWPIFQGPLTLFIFMSKFDFLCISDSCKCEALHSNCPWHTLQACTLTRWPWPIFHDPFNCEFLCQTLVFSAPVIAASVKPYIVIVLDIPVKHAPWPADLDLYFMVHWLVNFYVKLWFSLHLW